MKDEKVERGWKVVLVDEKNRFVSAIQYPNQGGVVYLAREWVQPREGCGPLTVFRSLKAAQHFKGYVLPAWGEHLLSHGKKLKICEVDYIPDIANAVWYGRCHISLSLLHSLNRGGLLPRSVAVAEKVRIRRCVDEKGEEV